VLTQIALDGRLFTAEEAARVQLVDELVAADALEARALELATDLGRAPFAYAQIKRALLAPTLSFLNPGIERRERDAWLDTWFSPDARRLLADAVARITKR
jgi:enoyl-CoA hydratase/carnithine racemase